MSVELIIRSVLLGVGLAMDAFSVSLADGLADPGMKKRRMFGIAGTFALFQFAMPVIGWVLVRTAVETFGWLEKFIPWIALLLLLYIGGKMLLEGLRENRGKSEAGNTCSDQTDAAYAGTDVQTAISSSDYAKADEQADVNERICAVSANDTAKKDSDADGKAGSLSAGELIIQGIATSIDALSVGFTIEHYTAPIAVASSLIIGAVTLVICMAGLGIGRKAGTRLSGKAAILGGCILIFIGIEIWARGVM